MLKDFLTSNAPELIERCRTKVAKRRAPQVTPSELAYGVPFFLAHLTELLSDESAHEVERCLASSSHNFSVEQVVHGYRDLRESITELADERQAPISVDEFGILDTRLDRAVAGAVTEFARQHQISRGRAEGELARNERLGVMAHEMRNLLNTAILAVSAIRRGSVGFAGATALALDRSFIGMRGLIDRTLAEVRLDDGPDSLQDVIEIGPFISEVQVASALEASNQGCELAVEPVEPGIFVDADRHILAAAVANLLENAFKFVRPDCEVLLRAHSSVGRVFIEVEDECGGAAEGAAEQNVPPFEHHHMELSGAGLTLSISRKAVEANGGTLSARHIPGRGCIFVIDLPAKAIRAAA